MTIDDSERDGGELEFRMVSVDAERLADKYARLPERLKMLQELERRIASIEQAVTRLVEAQTRLAQTLEKLLAPKTRPEYSPPQEVKYIA